MQNSTPPPQTKQNKTKLKSCPFWGHVPELGGSKSVGERGHVQKVLGKSVREGKTQFRKANCFPRLQRQGSHRLAFPAPLRGPWLALGPGWVQSGGPLS